MPKTDIDMRSGFTASEQSRVSFLDDDLFFFLFAYLDTALRTYMHPQR